MKIYLKVIDDDGTFVVVNALDEGNLSESVGSRRMLKGWGGVVNVGVLAIEIPDNSLELAFPETPVVKGTVAT